MGTSMDSTPEGQPGHTERMSGLDSLLGRRYERAGNLQDLGAAITAAIEATPEDHPGRGVWLRNLSNSLSDRYDWVGNLHLEAAIALSEAAIGATPDVTLTE